MADTALTHRRILNIAVPVVLGNITVPLLGLVDTGHFLMPQKQTDG